MHEAHEGVKVVDVVEAGTVAAQFATGTVAVKVATGTAVVNVTLVCCKS